MKYNFLFIVLAMQVFFHSCYEDLGNYDYVEINEISIDGIPEIISCDQMDSLIINIDLSGTLYSDEILFKYQWEVNGSVVADTKDLEVIANFPLGIQIGRFIITDKELGTKSFHYFKVNVSSSTAGDGLLVLSRYNSVSEMSFKRLDKENSIFSPNFYTSIVGESLGVNPKRLYRNYGPEPTNTNSGLIVEIDQSLKSLSDETLIEIGKDKFVDQHYFTNRGSVYPPKIDEFVVNTAWYLYLSNAPFGMSGHKKNLFVIANGQLFSDELILIPAMNISLNTTKIMKGSPLGGKLGSAMFLASLSQSGKQDLQPSDYLYVYDDDHGQFLFTSLNGNDIYEVPGWNSYGNYKIKYATHTNIKNLCIAILENSNNYKIIYMRVAGSKSEEANIGFNIISEIDLPINSINSITSLYSFKNEPYISISTDRSVYFQNIRALEDGVILDSESEVIKLSNFG